MLVNALYNIVDQIFIGQGVGMLGNAATNIAFPVTTISTAAALLLGIGGASNYNLEMGAGKERKASEIAGSALATLVITGVSVAAIILFFCIRCSFSSERQIQSCLMPQTMLASSPSVFRFLLCPSAETTLSAPTAVLRIP